ncbi:heme A synthase [uncultured Jatrophihabitans sp.]|uniref:COX15/CtaA family protein n=1 Tax=uncultured Jatrophihabitans sp. TaxID=1610747 RepID=UPI0035CB7B83
MRPVDDPVRSTAPERAAATAAIEPRRTFSRLPGWLQTATALRRLALASVIANVAIVVTGGAVRLSDSGLGCPTWPSCTNGSLTPTHQYAIHGVIEFTNRQLTFVLTIIAVATWLAAMALRRERPLATAAALGVPAQAVLGGLTVLTHLNPWLVALHFLLSMSIIAVTFVLWRRVAGAAELMPAPVRVQVPTGAVLLARLTVLVTATALAIGTVVTGSGPHAGDRADDGTVHRTGLNVASMAQLHADSVMVLIGLTVGLLALVTALRADSSIRQAAAVLLGVELGQAVIGYTQYFLHVPPLLVGLHMLGASLVWIAALNVLFRVQRSALSAPPAVRTAG